MAGIDGVSTKFARSVIFVTCAAMVTLSTATFAADSHSYIYAYSGGNYTSFAYGKHAGMCLTTAMHVSANLSFSAALPPNYTGYIIPTSWMVSDGAHTWHAKANNGLVYANFYISTDNNGAISAWSFSGIDGKVVRGTISPKYEVWSDSSTGIDNASDFVCPGVEFAQGSAGTWVEH